MNQNKKVIVEREGVVNTIETLFTEKASDKVPIERCAEKSEGKVDLQHQIEKRRNPFWEFDSANTTAHPTSYVYKPLLCKYRFDQDHISSVPECPYSHSEVESKFHPSKYRTNLCPLMEECPRKLVCESAHCYAELRTDVAKLYTFKKLIMAPESI